MQERRFLRDWAVEVQAPHRPAQLGSYKEAARGLVDTVIQVKHDAWLGRRVFLI